jgi:hypothetical protein
MGQPPPFFERLGTKLHEISGGRKPVPECVGVLGMGAANLFAGTGEKCVVSME